jgi:quercetin dioxygenase-like cupin family protein
MTDPETEVWIDENPIILTSGQSLIVPVHRKHGFRNVGSAILHIHAVLASAGFEATFEGSPEPVRRWLPSSEQLSQKS